ncbi:Colicin V production protein [Lachnospiraceae bacterium JC7]|nr:Colicin V production protein [Lachnospiraceae bacterium JC7]
MIDITELIKNDWLQISVITFMVIMLIFGYYKGLVKMSSNLVSIILSVLLTKSMRPYFQNWVTNSEYIRAYINERIHEKLQANIGNIGGTSSVDKAVLNDSLTSQALRSFIEDNPEESIENFYELIGLDKITDMVADRVTEFVLSVITFILLLIVITVLVKILFKILDKVAELPVLTAVNRISGSVLGLVESVIYVWIIFIILSLLPQKGLVASAVEQMNREGTWIYLLKEANIFIKIFEAIIN